MNKTIVVIAVFIFLAQAMLLFNGQIDDAFITYRYSENLANGHGLVWNVGEAPVEGYSNFLGVLHNAYLIKLGMNVEYWSQIFGIFFGVMTIIILYFISCEFTKNKTIASIPSLLLALTPPFARWSVGGLSTTMMAFFVLSFVGLMIEDIKKKRISWITTIAGLLVALTRTEGVVIVGIAVLPYLYFMRNTIKQKHLMRVIVPLSIFCTYFVWKFSYFGHLQSAPTYIKAGMFSGLSSVASFTLYMLPLIILVVIASKLKFSKKDIIVLSVIVGYFAVNFNISTHMAGFFRFFVPIIPLFFLFVPRIIEGRKLIVSTLIIILLSTSMLSGAFENEEIRHNVKWHKDYYYNCYMETQGMLGKQFKDTGYVVAMDEVGMFPYYSQLETYDYFGLNNYDIALMKGQKDKIAEYIMSKDPDLVFTHPIVIKQEHIIDGEKDQFIKMHTYTGFHNNEYFNEHYVLIGDWICEQPFETYRIKQYYSTRVFAKQEISEEVKEMID